MAVTQYKKVKNLELEEQIITNIGDYLPLSGGIIDGKISIKSSDGLSSFSINDNNFIECIISSFSEMGEKQKRYIGNQIDAANYTAFELFPTLSDIQAGWYDCNFKEFDVLPEPSEETFNLYEKYIVKSGETYYRINNSDSSYSWVETTDKSVAEVFDFDNKTATGLVYSITSPASTSAVYSVYTEIDRKNSNIIIDWGDGTVDFVCDESNENIIFNSYNDGSHSIKLIHNYTKSGKYITKIYGSGYLRIRNMEDQEYGKIPLISRIFEHDLPVASCLENISSICSSNTRLLQINIPDYYDAKSIMNIHGAFKSAKNLLHIYVNRTSNFLYKDYMAVGNAFFDCTNLKTSQFTLPCGVFAQKSSDGLADFYAYCVNLESKIEDLIPYTGFKNDLINFSGVFKGCKKLTGDVNSDKDNTNLNRYKVSDLLWNSTTTKFLHHYAAFTNCGISSQIPKDWGGTLEPAIKPIEELSSNLNKLSGDFNELSNNLIDNYELDQLKNEYRLNKLKNNGYSIINVDTTQTKTITFSSISSYSNSNFTINWGDGTIETIPGGATNKSHTYLSGEKYEILLDKNVNEIGYSNNNTLTSDVNAKAVTDVYLNKSIKCLPNNAFQNCTKLSTVYLAPTIINWGSHTFFNCTELCSIDIQLQIDNVKNNNNFRNFYNTPNLKQIILTDKIDAIGNQMFYNNISITELFIPSSVKTIGENAFLHMINCKIFDFSHHTQIPTLANKNAFYKRGYTDLLDCQIKVPAKLYDEWIISENWNELSSLIISV